jgi:hypothetical protein
MCFSATASFGASTILLTIGIVTIKKAQSTPQRFLAVIPLIFSVQQFAEGGLWLSLTHSAYASLHNFFMYLFLAFAQVVWPIFVPLAILLLETEPVRKKVLLAFLAIGILTGGYLLFCILFYKVEAFVSSHHIGYAQEFPLIHLRMSGVMYFIPTVVSAFISSVKPLRLFGGLILLSFIITKVFYSDYVISIWCYFAAIISLLILYIIILLNKPGRVTNYRWLTNTYN